MIYLDNAATTFPKPEIVYLAMDETNRKMGINAGRGAYKMARDASKLISDTKILIRQMLRAESTASVIFSPSITIAMNQIINGIEWPEGAVVYVSPYEHNAVARTINKLALKGVIRTKLIPIVDGSLEVDVERMKYEFSKEPPFAVFCTHVSNVTGYILPVMEIFHEAKKYGAITVLDTAQSLGLLEVDTKKIAVDIVGFTGHKCLYGPFGIGGFVNVTNIPLKVFITGGTGSDSLNLEMPMGNETKYEAASFNITAISGLKAAIESLDISAVFCHEKEIAEYLVSRLEPLRHVRVYTPNSDEHIGIVSLVVEGYNAEDVAMILDEDYDIAVRAGYHCAPYIHAYLKSERYLGTVRIGISQFTTKEEIDKVVEALEELV